MSLGGPIIASLSGLIQMLDVGWIKTWLVEISLVLASGLLETVSSLTDWFDLQLGWSSIALT